LRYSGVDLKKGSESMSIAMERMAYKPKYELIADSVRKSILSGVFKRGDRLPPDALLSRRYNVNTRTLAAGLRILVDEGLLSRAPKRGTVVVHDVFAAPETSNVVGAVMLSEGDVYADINRSMTKELTRRGLFPALVNQTVVDDTASVKSFLKAMVGERVKPFGFIIDGSYQFPYDFLIDDILNFHNVVFITKYHHSKKIDSAKYALVDYVEAGRLAARHFLSKGHKKLVCLAMYEKDFITPCFSMQARLFEGFAEVCREADVDLSPSHFWRLLHGSPLDEVVAELFAEPEPPSAIFAYSDSFVRHKVIPALAKVGVEHKRDVELIGFYDTRHAEECGFSSISICESEIARQAVALLCAETDEREVFIKPEIHVR
jgi:DNA-binding LacI/PurR family transcriptional regulator